MPNALKNKKILKFQTGARNAHLNKQYFLLLREMIIFCHFEFNNNDISTKRFDGDFLLVIF